MPEMCVLGSMRSPCKQQELPEIIDAHSLHGYLRAFLKASPVSGSLCWRGHAAGTTALIKPLVSEFTCAKAAGAYQET